MTYRCLLAAAALFLAASAAGCTDDTSAQISGQGTSGIDTGAGADGATGSDATPSNACGDGVCGPGETALSCREDCPASGAILCLATQCGTPWTACLGLDSCTSGVDCHLGCAGDATCETACADALDAAARYVYDDVVACGSENDCWAAAGGPDSCAGRCDAGFVEGALCSCDSNCVAFNDCCEDYRQECGPSDVVCGDGACEAPENSDTCPQDCPVGGPVCGDGTCEAPETAATCPEDCRAAGPECGDGTCEAPETAETCPADCEGVVDECGDGVCQPRESFETCPVDCKDEVSEVYACVAAACETEVAECMADSDCAAGLVCSQACEGTDIQCFIGCFSSAGFGAPVITIGLCAQQSGCFGGGPQGECGDGNCDQGENQQNCPADCQGGGDNCGNGVCDQFEQFTCPQDCEGGNDDCGNGVCDQFEQFTCPQDCEPDIPETGPELMACLEESCEDETDACREVEECGVQITCLEACDDTPQCLDDCVALGSPTPQGNTLTQCALQADCIEGGGPGPGPQCGDGTCNGQENTQNCPQDCDENPPQPQCGDGTCNGQENPNNCPQDCDGGSTGGPGEETIQCLSSNCGEQYATCQAEQECGAALVCIEACQDEGCIGDCVQQAGFGAAIGLGICAFQAGCF